MNPLKNKRIWVVALAAIILITVSFFAYQKSLVRTTLFEGTAMWNDSYAKQLWNRFSQGDVSSTACQRAIEKYKAQDPLDYTRIFESFYSYSKKRCFGFETRNFNGSNGKYAGHTDTVFDLITGDTIVSCTVDYSKEIQNHMLVCSDSQNVWTANNDSTTIPPPYPIASNTWAALNTLGKE